MVLHQTFIIILTLYAITCWPHVHAQTQAQDAGEVNVNAVSNNSPPANTIQLGQYHLFKIHDINTVPATILAAMRLIKESNLILKGYDYEAFRYIFSVSRIFLCYSADVLFY
jgi:hypothetical protein